MRPSESVMARNKFLSDECLWAVSSGETIFKFYRRSISRIGIFNVNRMCDDMRLYRLF